MSDSQTSIIVFGTMDCDVANLHRFKSEAERVVTATRSEPGCLAYHIVLEDEARGRFLTVERWADAQALAEHMKTPHVAAFTKVCGPHIRAADVSVFDAAASRSLMSDT